MSKIVMSKNCDTRSHSDHNVGQIVFMHVYGRLGEWAGLHRCSSPSFRKVPTCIMIIRSRTVLLCAHHTFSDRMLQPSLLFRAGGVPWLDFQKAALGSKLRDPEGLTLSKDLPNQGLVSDSPGSGLLIVSEVGMELGRLPSPWYCQNWRGLDRGAE